MVRSPAHHPKRVMGFYPRFAILESSIPLTHDEEGKMDIWLALFWTGPIGLGIFLMGLGVLF